jgi:hypothetical protein
MANAHKGVTVARFRVDHHRYFTLYHGVSRMTACKCECGAIRDTTDGRAHPRFANWAMYHEGPAVVHIAAGINWSGPAA